LAIAEFCRREKVSPASFYAWRKRLREGQSPGQPPFVPIEVATVEGPTGGVQIELPGGAVVALPAEASAELVATAIRAAIEGAGAKGEGRPC
jgi:transposase-like protein